MAYEKELKRSKDGKFVRYVGVNESGTKVKFRLGFDQPEAEKRLEAILALWKLNNDSCWKSEFLESAKEAASGKAPRLPPPEILENQTYILERAPEYLNQLIEARETGVNFEPFQIWKDEGVRLTKNLIQKNQRVLNQVLAGDPNIHLTGISLSEAFGKFADSLKKEYLLPDNAISTTGKSVLDELDSIKRYLPTAFTIENGKKKSLDLLSLDLAQLSFENCQLVYDAIRKRPVSERTGKRLKLRTTKNLVKILTRFFDWLDLSELSWSEPAKFRKIKKTVDPETAEEKFESQQAKAISVIPIDHLKIINQYCLENERCLLLLGLNCAFGEGESGQLRIPFIQGSEIRGIRFKTGNETRHLLWEETRKALDREIKKRPTIKNDHSIIFVTASGTPLWKKTSKGNYSNGISNRWHRLISRVRKDFPEVPAYSYNKLRKTAAQAILRHCSAESASMILAHKTISDDELLECYVQTPWERLYEAQKKWGEEILPLLEAPKETIKVAGGAISPKKIAAIRELFEQGKSKKEIGRILELSHMTVRRYLS